MISTGVGGERLGTGRGVRGHAQSHLLRIRSGIGRPWRLGLGVCYDGCFPEHARAAAGDGAHGYLCPSGYLAGSEHRRDLYYAARALDNTMYVVFANVVGGADPWRFNGGAAVYDPEGRPLARGADTGEDVLVATLDPDALAATRTAHTMLLDRPVDAGAARTALVA